MLIKINHETKGVIGIMNYENPTVDKIVEFCGSVLGYQGVTLSKYRTIKNSIEVHYDRRIRGETDTNDPVEFIKFLDETIKDIGMSVEVEK